MVSAQNDGREIRLRRVTWWGFGINILLAVFKVTAGWLGHSQAVVADGIHSITDTITDVAVILGSYYWSRPADDSHPYGHKRLETTVSIFIGGMLFLAGAGIGWDAVTSVYKTHVHHPRLIAFVAAAASIGIKESLYQWNRRVGNRIKSVSLTANAWHHRLDAFSSMPVLVAVGVAFVYPELHLLDHVAAFFVAILICYAAIGIILSGFKELVDQGAPPEVCEQIKDLVKTHPAVRQAHNIRTRYSGNLLCVDLHVVVSSQMTVYEGHRVAEEVKKLLLHEGPDILDTEVHIEPEEAARPDGEG
ncbi:MAG: cation diffusion facilitator family transporter [Desulfobacteraceae bacterium]|nr:cation diffusion facilitator family transporter [Desulfobacteraceae bacterium]MCF8096155.1 cation diffusion facilitator family transporter [Desulfobacteraceae bacterium]